MDRAVFSSVYSLLPYCLKILAKRLLYCSYVKFAFRVSNGSRPLLGRQHTPLLEASKPALWIPRYSYYNIWKIEMCWGALLRNAGSLTRCAKPRVTFEGSHTEKQWPP